MKYPLLPKRPPLPAPPAAMDTFGEPTVILLQSHLHIINPCIGGFPFVITFLKQPLTACEYFIIILKPDRTYIPIRMNIYYFGCKLIDLNNIMLRRAIN
jgi:hypothetical protein